MDLTGRLPPSKYRAASFSAVVSIPPNKPVSPGAPLPPVTPLGRLPYFGIAWRYRRMRIRPARRPEAFSRESVFPMHRSDSCRITIRAYREMGSEYIYYGEQLNSRKVACD